MLQNLRERSQSESGFTLVELLFVMLIIGLLAAIAIPSFFNQREKANDASAKEDAHTAQVAIETYATDNGGGYGGATATNLKGIETALNNATLTVTAADGSGTAAATDNYRVSVEADTTARDFWISRAASGVLSYGCAPVGGGCPTGGNWN
jgi:prepilin-type N-terminal cleavage/methylation domain-containing protein